MPTGGAGGANFVYFGVGGAKSWWWWRCCSVDSCKLLHSFSRRRCSCSSRLHEDSYRGIPMDNTKTAIGGIPMDNTKTAIGGIPFDNTKTAIGGIPWIIQRLLSGNPFDNTKTAIGGIPWTTQRRLLEVFRSINTKTAIGGIPFDNTKTAIGGIPMDNTKTAIGGIPFDNTKTAIGGIPFGGIPMDNNENSYRWHPLDTTKTAIGGMPTGGFGGGAPAPSFTPGAAPSRPAAANQSVYLGAGGGNLGAAQSAYFNLGAAGKPTVLVLLAVVAVLSHSWNFGLFRCSVRWCCGAPGATSCYFAPK
uniref:Uncharacterized protein n=1 Tax=Ditylenchus dipsaci TaxID=166011 RepID=A0A915CLB4_9BILA